MCKKIKVKRAADTEQRTLQVDIGEKDIGNYLKTNREISISLRKNFLSQVDKIL